MSDLRSGPILIAGAGIAGLTAALALAARGFRVRIVERAERLEEVGAGLQLSPNATRILDRLGVLPGLLTVAERPEAVVLRDARSLRELARVPLGAAGERRWGAPYLTAHRADLQGALLARTAQQPSIELTTGATVRGLTFQGGRPTALVESISGSTEIAGSLLIGADGVWSAVRGLIGQNGRNRFGGEVAWRRTVAADTAAGRSLAAIGAAGVVTAFLHPRFHLIVYPVSGGAAFNLAAFTRGPALAETWSGRTDAAPLRAAMRGAEPALARLADAGDAWTVWPIHTVEPSARWTNPDGVVLIGDAAHAMTPFAAQGAAMAIEDAELLAMHLSERPDDSASALAAWERARRPRIDRVARRGALNHFAWNAAGPVALARDIVLRLRPPENLAADMDWLYGWK